MNTVDIGGYVGKKYEEVGGCWGLVRTLCAGDGVSLPEDAGEALRGTLVLADLVSGHAGRGDIVVMRGTDDEFGQHVGYVLDGGFKVMHATRVGGVALTSLAALRKVDAWLRVVRPRKEVLGPQSLVLGPGEEGEVERREEGPVESGAVRVILIDNILTRARRAIWNVPFRVGMTVKQAVDSMWPWDWNGSGRLAMVNGVIKPEGYGVSEGDEITVGRSVGELSTAAMVAIAIVSALGSHFLMQAGLPRASGNGSAEEQRYGFNRQSVEAFSGGEVPVVLGEHEQYGGRVVAVVPGDDSTGSGETTIKILICLSEGEIAQIANQTSDFDRVAWTGMEGLNLSDQPFANFPQCYASGRMGTADQAPMPGFDDTEVVSEVGTGGGVQLLNTSGSDRTGGSASAEAYTFTTGTEVNAYVLRVRFPSGLYRSSTSAQIESQSVAYRHRWRTSDVGSGAGSWSAWIVVTVDRAEQSEFYSAPRTGGGGAGSGAINGGVAAVMDIQSERVTAEPTDALRVDAFVWDAVVEIQDTENTYAGFAMLGLELRSSAVLTSVPRVGTYIKGAKVRVWDGISDPSSPTFAVEWSNNPAWLALEAATNTTWGLATDDANINMPALCEFAQKCDEVKSRPGGGTRARFACNLILSQAADGIEVLQTICRAGQGAAVKAGDQWRFVMDDVQTTPAETFGDGSIVCDDDGLPVFEYTRELTEGGYHTPNQWVAQFDSADALNKIDAVTYPLDGELWLADEPTRTESVKFDGVTDVDQLRAMVKYHAKRRRGLSRSITFQTCREVVSVQPWDRFDLATSVVGWGTASGRIKRGEVGWVELDRTVSLSIGITYVVAVTHVDGTVETMEVGNDPGVYAAGDAITFTSDMAQAPGAGAEYAIGEEGIEMKPFTCTRVGVADAGKRIWSISGIEYDADVYDDSLDEVTLPDYGTLKDVLRAPGPVLGLRATEMNIGGVVQVGLSWRQAPEDAALTDHFRVFRRVVGTEAWVSVPSLSVATRAATIDVYETDKGYQFTVVAVSLGGAYLSPNDPSVPIVSTVLGLAALPPASPTGLIATHGTDNAYTLSWDAVDGAVEYQVLTAGDAASTLPNAGAEDCLVLGRTEATSYGPLELTPGVACDFWVRSVGENGRLSFTAAYVQVASPAVPSGTAVRGGAARTFALDSEGTLTNLTWDGAASRLELTNPTAAGEYLSPEVDLGSTATTEITVGLGTANDADDFVLSLNPFTVPSIAADQWGVVTTGPSVVGMLMPPWPDEEQTWGVEIRTHNGTTWSAWASLGICASVSVASLRKYQVKIPMERGNAPYRPALRSLKVVATA